MNWSVAKMDFSLIELNVLQSEGKIWVADLHFTDVFGTVDQMGVDILVVDVLVVDVLKLDVMALPLTSARSEAR